MSYKPKQIERQEAEMARYDEEVARRNAPPSEATPQADDTQEDISDSPVEVTPPPPDRSAELEAELNLYKQRYNTLQGKYNSEVPRLTQELNNLRHMVEQLTEQSKVPKPEKKVEIPEVTSADIDAFGADLVDLIKRQSAQTTRELVAGYESEIRSLREANKKLETQLSGVAETQQYSSRQQVLIKLGELVPDWEQLNQDERFLLWLGELDPMSGAPRQTYLDDALAKLDPTRLAHVFNTYKQVAGLVTPSQQKVARPEVQRQVAPGKSKATPSTPSVPSVDNRIWTSREIEAFYKDLSAGKYAGKEAEARNIEAQIDLAVQQGRFRP